MEERLQKIMAQAGLGSRRKCEELIKEGRVTVNGAAVEVGAKANPYQDKIVVDGEALPLPENKMYIMLHKPRNVLSDADDTGEGRTTVLDLVDVEAHLYPVGRLDMNSMGLILLTNDGNLAHKLSHPSYGHKKVYRVKVEGNVTNEDLEKWRDGVELEDGHTAPAGVVVEKRGDDHTWLVITMREGRKRQIRRVAAALGYPVLHLSREQLGPLKLGNLPLGQWRHLTADEMRALNRLIYLAEHPEERRRNKTQGKRPPDRGGRPAKPGSRPGGSARPPGRGGPPSNNDPNRRSGGNSRPAARRPSGDRGRR